jgi:hypothetical protein
MASAKRCQETRATRRSEIGAAAGAIPVTPVAASAPPVTSMAAIGESRVGGAGSREGVPVGRRDPDGAGRRRPAATQAMSERAARKGDAVMLKPTRISRFTKHGAYPATALASLTVVSVHGGNQAKIQITSTKEALGLVPTSWLIVKTAASPPSTAAARRDE